ncbi:TPA: bacteriocin [Streptococcus suis]|nr:bacteriocin [Streptococcus suis]HEM5084503.1 bacteriocin [Streptococcus suis]HEM5240848.1 bacteriocin [Streptococcus suis]HEM5318518.1 bacteriocin [Streptococcus suis]HEM5324134.1 bacteriocin [Streptococcus suis]
MNTLKTYFKGNKKTIYMLLIIVGLLTIYPPIFQTIYQVGRDFGRSFVNAVLP